MITQRTNDLVTLIQSMSKGEKKRFTTFAGGTDKRDRTIYLQLFQIYSQYGFIEDHFIFTRLPAIKKSQLSNLRAHLWEQLLECLRTIHAKNWTVLQVRANLDFAFLLHQRGMHHAAMSHTENAIALAERANHSSLTYHVLDEQRSLHSELEMPESQEMQPHFSDKTRKVIATVNFRDQILNTMMRLQREYYRQGYVKTDAEGNAVRQMFEQSMPRFQPQKGSPHDNILYYQTQVWYHYIMQDFVSCYRYAAKWVRTFSVHESMKHTDAVLYLKGLHHVLNALFMGDKLPAFLSYFESLQSIEKEWSEQERLELRPLYAEIYFTQFCNRIFLTGKYDEAMEEIQPIVELLHANPYHWQQRKQLTLYYKIACVSFGADRYSQCLDFLNIIISSPEDGSLQDIRSFARMLALICHYELGNEVFVSHQIKAVYRYLHKMRDLQSVQRAILLFLKNSPRWRQAEMNHHFQSLRNTLMDYRNHPYEKRPFLYLDIIAWLDSKLQNRRIQEVIRARRR